MLYPGILCLQAFLICFFSLNQCFLLGIVFFLINRVHNFVSSIIKDSKIEDNLCIHTGLLRI